MIEWPSENPPLPGVAARNEKALVPAAISWHDSQNDGRIPMRMLLQPLLTTK